MTLFKNIILSAGIAFAGIGSVYADPCEHLEDSLIEVYANCIENHPEYTCRDCLEIARDAFLSWNYSCDPAVIQSDDLGNAIRRLFQLSAACDK